VQVRDVLLVTIGYADGDIDLGDEFGRHPPAGLPYRDVSGTVDPGPADLGRGLMVGQLSGEELRLIEDACSQRGHFFYPHGHDGVRYALWRDVTEHALSEGAVVAPSWDEDGVIVTAVALSRWIQDNAAGTEVTARVVDYEDGSLQVRPQALFESSHAYRLPVIERDWLDAQDAAELRKLLDTFWQEREDLPERVSRAISRGELASWSRWPDHMLPLIVGGVEALIVTRIGELTANFKRRLPLLAQMVGLSGVDSDFAERIYIARSEGVHGSRVGLFSEWDAAAISDVRLATLLLRRTLRALVEHEVFARHFIDKESIDRLFGHQTVPQFVS
jgi:hypothetical protein